MKQSEIALMYASKGISVFPCNQNKRPATRDGFLSATTDASKIRRWWRKNPNYLIGCPNSNFVVLDIDDYGLCPSGRMLTDTALQRLFRETPKKAVVVTTQSGGRHIYFNKSCSLKRRINALPNIDLLGEGGYVILPDQKKYIANKPLWEMVDKLPDFPEEAFNRLSDEMLPARKLAKQLKRAGKTTSKVEDAAERKKTLTKKDIESLCAPVNISGKRIDSIDYKSGQIVFEQSDDIYKLNTIHNADYSILEKYKNGVLHLEAGDLTSERINALFHYPPIQAKLAKSMGLVVPSGLQDKTLMHSILPDHADENPSMGVRWSKDGTHLIIRDFSNHFTDRYENLDYNLVRLYCTIRYKTLVPRIKAPEFVVWFVRMMVEAGIINIDNLKKKFIMPRFGRNGIWRVAEGIRTLDAIKQLYAGYDGTTVFADKFCSAWCGVLPSAANRAKKALVEGGYLHVEGIFDCSGGTRDDGFYNTKLLSIIDRAKADSINTHSETDNEGTVMSDKEQVTLRGFSVSEASYEKIRNFCKDYKIGDVPLRKNMFVETAIVDGVVPKEPPQTTTSFSIRELTLSIVPSMNGSDQILMVSGECPEIEEVFWKDNEQFDPKVLISEEPMVGVTISSNFDGAEISLESLELKLRDYLEGELVLDTFFVRYGSSESIMNYVLDGKEPEGE